MEFGKKIPFYSGPKDGRSHPKHQKLLKPLARRLQDRLYETQVEGGENFPRQGAHVYAPTHPTIVDPLTFYCLYEADQDIRIMANEQMMRGPLGKAMTWAGAFPVNRESAQGVTLQHCREVLQDNKGLAIFPEGGMSPIWGQVGPIKKGAAGSALRGGAESLVPIAIHYTGGDAQARPSKSQWLKAACKTLTRSALAFAGPVGAAVSLAWSGANLGALAGAEAGKHLTPQPKPWLQSRNLARVLGQGLGWVGGAVGLSLVAAGASAPFLVAASLAAGGASLGLAALHQRRPQVKVKVAEPMVVDGSNAEELSRRLQERLGQTKASISGVAYDPQASKLRA